MLFEETTRTLLCGDLFTHVGQTAALTSDDIVEPAMEAEAMFRQASLAPDTPLVMSRLAELQPETLALMHGASYNGDCGQALLDLANAYDERYLARV